MTIAILPFTPERATFFDKFNRDWIEQFFTIEPFDDLVLTQPQTMIVDKGGEIWFGALNGTIVGACALLPLEPGILEFTKLGVDANARGAGVARTLLRHCRDRAKEKGAHILRIYTNTQLAAANNLYRSEHFMEIDMSPEQRKRYARADIMYDLPLK